MVRKFQKLCYVIALIGYKLGTSIGADSTCNVQTINNRLIADCSKQNFTQVPQSLSHDIEVLDLSKNFRMDLGKDSFKNYTHLIELKIEQLKLRGSLSKVLIHHETFLPLTKLEILLLNDAKIFQIPMKWPSNIRILNVDENRLKNVHLMNLNKLENLSIELNDLIDLPEMNKLAPLKILHAGRNPMEKLTAESLSQYCLLESVEMDLQMKGITDKYCQCIRIKKFLAKIQLKGSIRLGCVKQSDSSNCDFNFTEAAKNRYKCLKRHGKIGDKKESDYVHEFNDLGTGDGGFFANQEAGSESYDDGDDGANGDTTPQPEQYRGVLYWIWRVLFTFLIITVITGFIIKAYKYIKKRRSSIESSDPEEEEEEEVEE